MSENNNQNKNAAEEIVEKIKELVQKGNVNRIRVKHNDTIVLNIPMTAGAIGGIIGLAVAPWALVIATIATFGLGCKVEVENEKGEINVINALQINKKENNSSKKENNEEE